MGITVKVNSLEDMCDMMQNIMRKQERKRKMMM